MLPTTNAQRYLQAYYTAPFSDWDEAIKFDDARDGSAWSAANARYNDFFREIVDTVRVRGCAAVRHQGQRRLHRLQGRGSRHQRVHRPVQGRQHRFGVQRGARFEHCRLRRHHRLRRVRTGRRADRMVHVAGRPAGPGRRCAGPAVSDIQDQPPDDDGPALAGVRHGTDGRDVHRRPRRPDAVGLQAVPRGSRGVQARRRRCGHATGHRTGSDRPRRHDLDTAGADGGHQTRAARTIGHADRAGLSGSRDVAGLRPCRHRGPAVECDRQDQHLGGVRPGCGVHPHAGAVDGRHHLRRLSRRDAARAIVRATRSADSRPAPRRSVPGTTTSPCPCVHATSSATSPLRSTT